MQYIVHYKLTIAGKTILEGNMPFEVVSEEQVTQYVARIFNLGYLQTYYDDVCFDYQIGKPKEGNILCI